MKTIILFLNFILFASYLMSQTVTPQIIGTTGNISNQNNTQISYTVGEPVVQTVSSGNTIITQGYQQPHYNISVIHEQQDVLPNLILFPNPVNNNLTIQFNNNQQTFINIYLFDAIGKQLFFMQQLLSVNAFVDIPMNSYAAGKYILTIVIPNLNQTKTFEIIKNN